MSSGISIGALPKAMTLSSLSQAFSKAGEDQHLRFSEAKGLHTHGSREFSRVDVLAKFRNSGALTERAQLRQDAVQHVKQAIDNQYGAGMGERVFASLTDKGDIDAGGVTKHDLAALDNEAQRMSDADIALAGNKLGKSVGSVLSAAVNSYGSVMGQIDADRQPELRHAMAEAVNKLPAGATKAQMERAAQGVLLLDHVLTKAAGHTHSDGKKGYNGVTTKLVTTLIEQATQPPKSSDSAEIRNLANAPMESLFKHFDKVATIASEPKPKLLSKAVTLDQLVSRPIAERAGILSDFLKTETTKALKGGGGAESFIRGNENGAHYDVLAHQVEGHFGPRMSAVQSELAKFGSIEYGSTKIGALKNPDGEKLSEEQVRQKVQDFADAYDGAMKILFGGTSSQDIADDVATLPQDFCDLLRTAKNALPKAEAEVIRGQQAILKRGEKLPLFGDKPTLAAQERAELRPERKVEAGDISKFGLDAKVATMPALRGWNHLFTEQVGLLKDKNFLPFARMNQAVANGKDPTRAVEEGGKDRPPDHCADIIKATYTKWQAAGEAWIAAATARGRDFS